MITIKGKDYYIKKEGNGFPVIFLNSSLLNSDMWIKQIEYFNKTNEIITFDFFGQGRSGKPHIKYTNYDSVRDILDFYKIKKCIVVGCSYGSSVAIDFTLEYPEYVEKLILITPAINGYRYPLSLFLNSMSNYLTCKKIGNKKGFEKFAKNKYWNYFLPKNENDFNIVKKAFEDNNVFYNSNQSLCIVRKPVAINCIHKIEKRILIITSEGDSLFNKKVADVIYNRLPNAKKEKILNSGHLPNIEKAEVVNSLIGSFINSK